ncbi:MAG: class I SAM-dependent methyltransferase [Nanoarchaeota archaeon]
MTKKITFSFGKNWQRYLKEAYNEKNVQLAKDSIKNFLGVENLNGKTFLDIGCGSGLFSLSAYQLGAKNVISFDVDKYSVECCEYLRDKVSKPENWQVYHGSILDDKFLATIPNADIVYSWGVLHHTGNMWAAIANAAKKIKEGGYFYIAIYNKHLGLRGSKNQLKLKKLYNRCPFVLKKFLEYSLWSSYITKNFLKFKNPFKIIKSRENTPHFRGMNFGIDIFDWLGGLPYEFATAQEVFEFCKNKLKLQIVNMYIVDETNALGNNHFLFKK